MAPTTADATVTIAKNVLFHSIEVNCPSGVRKRADFIALRATVRELPISEECTVTFQGSQPAKATLSGGQTKSCTFAPTHCTLL